VTRYELHFEVESIRLLESQQITGVYRKMGAEMVRLAKDARKTFDPKVESMLLRAHRQWNSGKLRSSFCLILAAAKLGDEYAQQNLGYFYDVGIGVKPNPSAAMHWYLRAYRQGDACSANNIATIYRDEHDTKRALLWFERAIKLGDIDANLEIAKVYLREKDQFAKA
jgi:TPR repeat protein